MLLALEATFFNSSSGFIPAGPPEQLNGSGFANASKFSSTLGIVTVASPRTNITSGLPVIVFADYSCWCPILQAFIPPEATNLSSKLNLGSGS